MSRPYSVRDDPRVIEHVDREVAAAPVLSRETFDAVAVLLRPYLVKEKAA